MQGKQFKLSTAGYKKLIFKFNTVECIDLIYMSDKKNQRKLSNHDGDRHQFYNERNELVFEKLSSIRTKKWKLVEYASKRATFQLARTRGKYRKRDKKLSTIVSGSGMSVYGEMK